ncbi:MAG: RNA 2',3'-cyclic phosphodiesterase [Chloroflexi bacterium]|nr:RNA 2',3'-cyclic phosphodiesterase [Chloroflexota bacterium]
MAKVRAFVAIELGHHLKTALADAQRRLAKAADLPVRWVRPESIHLTLQFLGDVGEESLDDITQALALAAESSQPFTIGLGEFGAFPSMKRARVLWIRVTGDEAALQTIRGSIANALARVGFQPEDRAFQAHLTLGRTRGAPLAVPPEAILDVRIANLAEAPHQRITHLSLMRSMLKPDGAVYTRLRSIQLGTRLSE